MKILIKVWQFLRGKKTYIGAILYLLGKYILPEPAASIVIMIADIIMGVGVADKVRSEGTNQMKLLKLRRLHHD